jgi:hypothetical protein
MPPDRHTPVDAPSAKPSRPDGDKPGVVRAACARALSRAAGVVDEAPPAQAGPAATNGRGATNFRYDPDLPPDAPPGESLAQWRRERASSGTDAPTSRRRLAGVMRRWARRLDGRIIDTHQLPLG